MNETRMTAVEVDEDGHVTNQGESPRDTEAIKAEGDALSAEKQAIEEKDERDQADHDRLRAIDARFEELSHELMAAMLDKLFSGGAQQQPVSPLAQRIQIGFERAHQVNRLLAASHMTYLAPVRLADEILSIKGLLAGVYALLEEKGVASREELATTQVKGLEDVVDHEAEHHLDEDDRASLTPAWVEQHDPLDHDPTADDPTADDPTDD